MDFNASLIRMTALAMKRRGLLAAGYKLLSVGGSTYEHPGAPPWDVKPWRRLTVRNSTGFIQIDPARWPGPGSNMVSHRQFYLSTVDTALHKCTSRIHALYSLECRSVK